MKSKIFFVISILLLALICIGSMVSINKLNELNTQLEFEKNEKSQQQERIDDLFIEELQSIGESWNFLDTTWEENVTALNQSKMICDFAGRTLQITSYQDNDLAECITSLMVCLENMMDDEGMFQEAVDDGTIDEIHLQLAELWVGLSQDDNTRWRAAMDELMKIIQ